MAWATRLIAWASRGGGWLCPGCGEVGERGVAGGLGGHALAQRRLFAEQAGMCPHGRLQLGDEIFDLLLRVPIEVRASAVLGGS